MFNTLCSKKIAVHIFHDFWPKNFRFTFRWNRRGELQRGLLYGVANFCQETAFTAIPIMSKEMALRALMGEISRSVHTKTNVNCQFNMNTYWCYKGNDKKKEMQQMPRTNYIRPKYCLVWTSRSNPNAGQFDRDRLLPFYRTWAYIFTIIGPSKLHLRHIC